MLRPCSPGYRSRPHPVHERPHRKNTSTVWGFSFRGLNGRRLQLIDCQNLFCEVDKYARLAHPEITGYSGRSRIRQRFTLPMKS